MIQNHSLANVQSAVFLMGFVWAPSGVPGKQAGGFLFFLLPLVWVLLVGGQSVGARAHGPFLESRLQRCHKVCRAEACERWGSDKGSLIGMWLILSCCLSLLTMSQKKCTPSWWRP